MDRRTDSGEQMALKISPTRFFFFFFFFFKQEGHHGPLTLT